MMGPDRTCVACGHVHDYLTPVYRCEGCGTWGQDFYELRPPSWWRRWFRAFFPLVLVAGCGSSKLTPVYDCTRVPYTSVEFDDQVVACGEDSECTTRVMQTHCQETGGGR